VACPPGQSQGGPDPVEEIGGTSTCFLIRLIPTSTLEDASLLKAGIQAGYGSPAVRTVARAGCPHAPLDPMAGDRGPPRHVIIRMRRSLSRPR
jgi:hypothetical protein